MPSALFEDLVLRGTATKFFPAFVYGTAWKKGKSADLGYQAICTGFRGIDTAAQPKHYREDLVGDGIRKALKEGKATRDNLFVRAIGIISIASILLTGDDSGSDEIYFNKWARPFKYAV